jgi:putative copper export protein/mono/diheme cytochrome c family protein
MPAAADVVAILARFGQVASACLLTGIFAFLVFVMHPAARVAGPTARDRFARLDRRLLSLATIAVCVVMAMGVIDLTRQALVAAGSRTLPTLAQTALTLLAETRYGDVWLVRHALWLLLATLLVLRGGEHDSRDWLALRIGGLLLTAVGLGVGAAAGHAASAPPPSGRAVTADMLHLVSAGTWAGALVPFAMLLRASRPGDSATLPAAATVVAVRRFSGLGFLSVAVLLGTGAHATLQQVASPAALFGTRYGHWLLVKLGLLVPLFGIALLNRAFLRPRLERASDPLDTGVLVARLRRLVILEALLVSLVLGVVAVLGLTTPARHDPITWPLPFRVSWETTIDLPGVSRRVGVGSLLAGLGVAGIAVASVVRRWGWPVAAVGATVVVLGVAIAVPPLIVDAHPTTYVRPTVPYTVASIARGHAVYREQCSSCHGAVGAGPAANAPPPPPDLTARPATDRTAGDVFWSLTHGVRGSATHAFGDRLSPEARWDVINFLRMLAAGAQSRDLGPTVSARPVVVAPDFAYTPGVGPDRFLRQYRGQTILLLVLFQLPESLDRLSHLAKVHFDLRTLGAEILAVPVREAAGVYRALGSRPLLFPFVIEGAEEVTISYGLLGHNSSVDGKLPGSPMPAHMELLVDRVGYVRARWIPVGSPDGPGGWSDPSALLQEVDRLAREPISVAPVSDEEIH